MNLREIFINIHLPDKILKRLWTFVDISEQVKVKEGKLLLRIRLSALFSGLRSLPPNIPWSSPVLLGSAQDAGLQLLPWMGWVYIDNTMKSSVLGYLDLFSQEPQVLPRTSPIWSNVHFTNGCKQRKPLQTKPPLSISHMGGKNQAQLKRGLTDGMFGDNAGPCKVYTSVGAWST